jgi:hypothetical protein
MKFRFTVLIVLVSLFLAACSLAEDITPPPGYTSPTSIQTIIPATQTSVPPSTATNVPTSPAATSTGKNTPAAPVDVTPGTTDTTPSAGVSPTPKPAGVVISGSVTVASGASIPDGTIATLLLYNTIAGQVSQRLTIPILEDGNFEFADVPGDANTVFLVTVDYSGVTYDSVPKQFDSATLTYDMPVTVYETTNDQNVLAITQAHLQFDFSAAEKVQVMSLYIISNPGQDAVTVVSDGSTIPFIKIPEGAESVNFQLAQSSSPLMSATDGFALLPGADKQYGIIATFSLPYTKRLNFIQPFILPVSSATVIVPEGVKVRSDQLTDAGSQNSTSTPPTTFHLYQTSSLASGSSLSLTISGKPGDKAGFVLDQRTLLIIGVSAVGLILIGLGIFLFLRDRKLRKMEDEEDLAENLDPDSLGDDRESIMDAIIALDDQFKAGDILKEAFDKRREELKERLKNLA